jgi:phosphoglycerate dehydrogenase-like enzyme
MNDAANEKLAPRNPAETKLVICAYFKFTLLRPPDELAGQLRQRWPEMRVVHLPHPKELAPELPDTNIFVGYSLRPEQVGLARRLEWMHCISAGVSQLMFPELRDSGVIVTNASGVHATTMAEHVIGMILALLRDFPGAMRYQSQSRWAQQEIWDGRARPRELHGQTAVLVGFGAIGRAVAELLRAFGVHVWAVTRTGQADPALVERAFPVTQIENALANADTVILAAPETPETHHLIGKSDLAMMKPTAILINVARGSLVDEPALVHALQNHWIAAAGLDVTEQEPLPPESPLWPLENVLITPHISGVTERLWERETELLIDNLERWFSGRPLRNRVDLARGY